MQAPDVLIVGCGVGGLCTAYHLARRGVSVVALDRTEPGTQASPRAAGQSVSAQVDPAIGTLMRRSMDQIAGFTGMTGVPFAFHRVGSVKYACSEWAAGVIEREVARAAGEGTRVSVIGLDEASQDRSIRVGTVITAVAGKAVSSVMELQSILNDTPAELCRIETAPQAAPVVAGAE